ncbi:GNAT family N-acetyltransferase [Plantactinospora sp. WMMB334]|uniref:GNAT family N-acetyltransferase n=1 Tax=Plantactinospora sp. WMMB334 TaxID=3404119 RepID=UPI003B936F9F
MRRRSSPSPPGDFTAPGRRRGGGVRLLGAVEEAAAAYGMSTMRLDTRHDLVEARALYARQGYREVPAYSVDPYAEHWFEKRLGGLDGGAGQGVIRRRT